MNKKYYFSVASMFRNEAWNLKEWIEHYKFHGADHIYLIDALALPLIPPGPHTFSAMVTARLTVQESLQQ